ncbi:MAG: thermonuclease family protein [Desulfovibrio sp.]
MYEVSKIIKVIDGDTIRCNIEGLPDIIGQNISIRFSGIDTPELNDPDPSIAAKARLAREYVAQRLSKAHTVYIIDRERGSFFRIVARIIVDGEDLCAELAKMHF